jgi:hypothetical protein
MTIVGMNLFLLGSVLLKENSWVHFFVAFI